MSFLKRNSQADNEKRVPSTPGDRFIPQRERSSVFGDPRGFFQMESSHTESAFRERENSSNMTALNLSLATNERQQIREEHKNNIMQAMINSKAIAEGHQFVSLAGKKQELLPLRNLKLTRGNRKKRNESNDSFDSNGNYQESDPVKCIQQQRQGKQTLARQVKLTLNANRRQRDQEI